MRIVDIDHYAMFGKSPLNRISARYKLLAVFLVLVCVVLLKNYIIMSAIYAFLLLIVMISGVPRIKVILMSLYPLLFMFLFLFSIKNLSYQLAFLLLFKVLSSSTSFVLLVMTTTYIEIFSKLQRFLPSFLVNVLFLTYRSIFILWGSLENIQLAMYIRGKPQLSRPIYSLKLIANAAGNLIIKAMESSEKIYDSMQLRGYSNNLKYLRK